MYTTLRAEELELVTGFLSRFDALDADARLRLGRSMAIRFGAPGAAQLDEAAVRAFLKARLAGG